ncbi:hypothetical protein V6N13_096038 [Hibiscus sabdariffa]
MTEKQVIESIPRIINQFAQAAKRLHQHRARIFWIHNTGPIGCLPFHVLDYTSTENVYRKGCIRSHNEVAQEFNRHLKESVIQLRMQFPDAALTYVDIYSAKYSLISYGKHHRFENLLGYCGGHYRDNLCWRKKIENGHLVTAWNVLRKFTRVLVQSVELTNKAIEFLKGFYELIDSDLDTNLLPIEVKNLLDLESIGTCHCDRSGNKLTPRHKEMAFYRDFRDEKSYIQLILEEAVRMLKSVYLKFEPPEKPSIYLMSLNDRRDLEEILEGIVIPAASQLRIEERKERIHCPLK